MALLITILCFFLMELAPYDAIDAMTGPNMPYEQVLAIKEKYGYDKPPIVRYLRWISGVLQGDFGYSLLTHRSIMQDLKVRIINTMILLIPSYLSAIFFSTVFGMTAAVKEGKWQEKIVDAVCSFGMATPSFWVGMIVIYFFAYSMKAFPVLGMYTIGSNRTFADFLWHFFLPYCTLTFAFLPDLTLYIKISTAKELTQPYIRTQKSLGFSPYKILIIHVLKNVSFTIITKASIAIPMIITGAAITESVFGWPGVGPYFLQALQGFDYPIIMTILLLSSLFVMIANLCADLLYAAADPRIREGSENAK